MHKTKTKKPDVLETLVKGLTVAEREHLQRLLNTHELKVGEFTTAAGLVRVPHQCPDCDVDFVKERNLLLEKKEVVRQYVETNLDGSDVRDLDPDDPPEASELLKVSCSNCQLIFHPGT